MIELRPHQVANVQLLLSSLRQYGGAIDGSSTGTGKTLTFLGLCKAVGARPAIITRKPIIPSWEKACAQIGIEPVFIANYEAVRSKKFPFVEVRRKLNPKTGKEVVCGFDWKLPEGRVIFAFDEAQALRSKSGNSLMALHAFRRFKTVLISATPFQTPMEAETIGQIIGLFNQGTHYRWLFENGCKKDYFGHMKFIGDMKDPPSKVPGTNAERGRQFMLELNATIFPSRGCRTSHSDIPGFPDTLISVEEIETGEADAITALYLKELEERRAEDHANACKDVDPEFHHLVEVLPIVNNLRYRQEAELLKCKAIAEMAEMSREKGRPCAIFVNFDQSVEYLAELLDCQAIIRGDDSGGMHRTRPTLNRRLVVEAFQANKVPFVIVNIAAGGAGLSLHDDVTQVERDTLISPPYSAVALKQVLGRPHRLGGGGSTQKILFAHGTIEEKVMNRVKIRLDNLDALVDGDLDVTA